MTRNELISAAIRVFGVILLVITLTEIPSFLIMAFTTIYTAIKLSINTTVGTAFDFFIAAGLGTRFFVLLIQGILGFYLMGGGKWFYAKATKDESLAPR